MNSKLEAVLNPHLGDQLIIPGDLAVYTIEHVAGLYTIRNKYGSLEALICQLESNDKFIILKKAWFGMNVKKKVFFENIEWLGKEKAA